MVFKTSLIHQIYANNHVNITFDVLVCQLNDQCWLLQKKMPRICDLRALWKFIVRPNVKGFGDNALTTNEINFFSKFTSGNLIEYPYQL
jgi:hypothetical protein